MCTNPQSSFHGAPNKFNDLLRLLPSLCHAHLRLPIPVWPSVLHKAYVQHFFLELQILLILFSKALLNHGGVSDLQMSPNVIVDLSLEGIGSVPICEGGSHTEGRAEQAKELGNTLDRIASFVLGAI